MPKLKKAPQKPVLEALRYLFFVFYLAALGGMIYFSRNSLTARQAEESMRQKEILIRSVLPPFDNEPWREPFRVEETDIFTARKISKSFSPSVAGESVASEFERPVGFAFESRPSGNDTVKVFMGVTADSKITGVKAAGFGIAEAQNKFLQELKGMDLGWVNTELQAGISDAKTKQIAGAVKEGLDFFSRNRDEIFKKAGVVIAQPPPPAPPLQTHSVPGVRVLPSVPQERPEASEPVIPQPPMEENTHEAE